MVLVIVVTSETWNVVVKSEETGQAYSTGNGMHKGSDEKVNRNNTPAPSSFVQMTAHTAPPSPEPAPYVPSPSPATGMHIIFESLDITLSYVMYVW
jgi:hypothetical protein